MKCGVLTNSEERVMDWMRRGSVWIVRKDRYRDRQIDRYEDIDEMTRLKHIDRIV